jgi:hypothetical protein
MLRRSPKRSCLIVIGLAAVAAAAFLASCTAPNDLAAIQQYASVTAQSGSSFAALAADYAASCERYRKLLLGVIETDTTSQPVATMITNNPQLAALLIPNASPQPGYVAPAPVDSGSPPSAATPVAPLAAAAPTDSNYCNTAREISVSWNNANAVVLDYVQSLGNLAGVDAIPSPNPSPFVAGLAAAGVSSAATQAVSNLIVTITNFFLNQERNREITRFLSAVNPTFPGAIGALEQVDGYYSTRLDNEYRQTINQYNAYAFNTYTHPESHYGRHVPSRQQVAADLLRVKSVVQASLSATNQRLRACADYGAAVETILATHRQLYAASQRGATFADYMRIVQTTGAPVVTNLIDLAKAVK